MFAELIFCTKNIYPVIICDPKYESNTAKIISGFFHSSFNYEVSIGLNKNVYLVTWAFLSSTENYDCI